MSLDPVESTHALVVVSLVGDGRARGLAHGRALAAAVASAAAALRGHLEATGHPGLGARLEASPLCRVAAATAPELWAEVEGIAEGAGVALRDVLMLTFLDEVWALADASGGSGADGGSATGSGVGCTAVCRGGGEACAVAGQTMDLPRWCAGRLVVLRLRAAAAPPALVMSYPGCIGLCGAHAGGLGVTANALPQLGFSEAGLGVAFIVRSLLGVGGVAEAEALLRRVPHAAGQVRAVLLLR